MNRRGSDLAVVEVYLRDSTGCVTRRALNSSWTAMVTVRNFPSGFRKYIFTKGDCAAAGRAFATSMGRFCGGRGAAGSGRGARWGSAWVKVKSENRQLYIKVYVTFQPSFSRNVISHADIFYPQKILQ